MMQEKKVVDVTEVLEALGIAKEKWQDYTKKDSARVAPKVVPASIGAMKSSTSSKREVV
ncbi:hypothetical protein MO973_43990 [Paenibacillus sp. TRM 82003]|nr:hypothetical protein [Paenibacillus sp. TRM 82003]